MPAGRKTKFTTKAVRTILASLRAGHPDKLACLQAGISYETFYCWKNKKPEFSKACHEARAAASIPLINKIKDHFDKDWRAAAYLLERALPDVFGKTADVVVQQTVNVQTGVQVDDNRALEMVLSQAKADEALQRN